MRPYSYVRGDEVMGSLRVITVVEARLKELLAEWLRDVEVDEDFYRATYLDVHEKINGNEISSARAHYISDGYFEDRWPRPILVDEGWYIDQYADVKAAVDAGTFMSGTQHFKLAGFKEGRLPHEGWNLARDKVVSGLRRISR